MRKWKITPRNPELSPGKFTTKPEGSVLVGIADLYKKERRFSRWKLDKKEMYLVVQVCRDIKLNGIENTICVVGLRETIEDAEKLRYDTREIHRRNRLSIREP